MDVNDYCGDNAGVKDEGDGEQGCSREGLACRTQLPSLS